MSNIGLNIDVMSDTPSATNGMDSVVQKGHIINRLSDEQSPRVTMAAKDSLATEEQLNQQIHVSAKSETESDFDAELSATEATEKQSSKQSISASIVSLPQQPTPVKTSSIISSLQSVSNSAKKAMESTVDTVVASASNVIANSLTSEITTAIEQSEIVHSSSSNEVAGGGSNSQNKDKDKEILQLKKALKRKIQVFYSYNTTLSYMCVHVCLLILHVSLLRVGNRKAE